jgi:hypothetical protein
MPRKTFIQVRRDTAANWTSINPVLASGETGCETDTNRTKIGNGVSTWSQLGYQNLPYYGAFQDSTSQTIAALNVAYPMKLDTTDYSNGVSVMSDGTYPTRITFANTGTYNLQWSGQFVNADTGKTPFDIAVWLRKNAVDIPGSTGHITVPARYTHGNNTIDGSIISGWNFFVRVNAGDYIQIMWHADSTSIKLAGLDYYPEVTTATSSTPVLPGTASLVVTVSHVA